MSKFVEIFFVLLFCLLTSLTRLDQFAGHKSGNWVPACTQFLLVLSPLLFNR